MLTELSHIFGGHLAIEWNRMASSRTIRLSSSGSPILQKPRVFHMGEAGFWVETVRERERGNE